MSKGSVNTFLFSISNGILFVIFTSISELLSFFYALITSTSDLPIYKIAKLF